MVELYISTMWRRGVLFCFHHVELAARSQDRILHWGDTEAARVLTTVF